MSIEYDVDKDADQWIEKAILKYSKVESPVFSLEDATILGDIAAKEAEKVGVQIVFSLVDALGHQRFFYSMDNVLLISHKLAFQKAWTAVSLRMTTHELYEQVQPGMSLYGLQHEPKICCLGGGFPCWFNGELLGAIGISGGTVQQDIAIVRSCMYRFSQTRYLITPFQ